MELASNERTALELVAGLRSLQSAGKLCDVTLETDDGARVSAHRCVLAAASPFFCAMFLSDLAERTSTVIRLTDVAGDVLEAVIDYVYQGGLQLTDCEAAAGLLEAADRLRIQPLLQDCSDFLTSQLSHDNCLGVREFSRLHNCQELFSSSTDFILEHFSAVSTSGQFLALDFDPLCELLARDHLQAPGEEAVYRAVVRWTRHDLQSRRDKFPDLMAHVRLPFASPDFLDSEVATEELVSAGEQCKELLDEAYLYQNSPEKRHSLKYSLRTVPRRLSSGLDSILLIGGMSRVAPSSTVLQYREDCWREVGSVQAPCYGLASCVLGHRLYVVGGYCESGQGYMGSVQCCDLRTETWFPLASIATPRRYHTVAVLYGLLYVCGGQTVKSVTSSVECYNPSRDQWKGVCPMTVPRMYHGLAEVGGHLLSVGGHNGRERLASVECYNPINNTWSLVRPLPSPRSVMGVASLQDSLYVAGGYSGQRYLDSVLCYDPGQDTWFEVAPMTSQRSAFGLVAHQGRLFACGGFNGSFLSSMETFWPSAVIWSPATDAPTPLVHFSVCST